MKSEEKIKLIETFNKLLFDNYFGDWGSVESKDDAFIELRYKNKFVSLLFVYEDKECLIFSDVEQIFFEAKSLISACYEFLAVKLNDLD